MALTEFECLERRNKITEELNIEGCHFGELLSRTVAEMNKKLMSKCAGFETVANIMLDLGKKNKKELEGIKKMTVDAISCTHAAQQTVKEIKGTSDKIALRLLWIILGGNSLFLGAHLAVMFLSK